MYSVYQVIPGRITEIRQVSLHEDLDDAEGWLECNKDFGMFIVYGEVEAVKLT